MRLRTALLSVACASLAVPTAAPASEAPALLAAGSANLTHVANLEHAKAPGSATAAKGSDIEFASLDVSASPEAEAAGLTGVREYAIMGTINIDSVANSGMQIVDITDPTKPVRVGLFACTNGQGDVQVFHRADLGRTFATYTTDTSGTATSKCYQDAKTKGYTSEDSGTFIVDITNPYKPSLRRFITIATGSHNQTVHPSGMYLYNSNNELTRPGTSAIEIHDITDIDSPKALPALPISPGLDSHDLTFSADGKRAYSAAITQTVIINTEDPAAPSVISRIVDPTLGIQHQSDPVTITDPVLGKRTFVAITDEFAGAAGNGWCPGGGVGIYDVTGDLEKNPVRVGYWNIPEARPAAGGTAATGTSLRCTSHVLRFYPEQKLMTIGWYNAGTRVVDISGLVGASVGVAPAVGNVPVGMKEVAYRWMDNSEVWAAKIHKFNTDGTAYVFSNDLRRGLDVFKYDSKAPKAEQTGTWLDAAGVAAKPKMALTLGELAPLCARLT